MDDGQVTLARIERALERARTLRSAHLRAILTRGGPSNRIGGALALLSLLCAVGLLYAAAFPPQPSARAAQRDLASVSK